MSTEKMLTSKGASAYLKLSEQYVRRLYNRGKLVGYRPNGGKIYFALEDLESFLRRNRSMSEEEILSKSLTFKKLQYECI